MLEARLSVLPVPGAANSQSPLETGSRRLSRWASRAAVLGFSAAGGMRSVIHDALPML